MTVYIDNVAFSTPTIPLHNMLADTVTELHTVAGDIGLELFWWKGGLQDEPSRYHVPDNLFEQAVRKGAVPVTPEQLAAMCYRFRKTGALGEPNESIEWMKTHMRMRSDMARRQSSRNHA